MIVVVGWMMVPLGERSTGAACGWAWRWAALALGSPGGDCRGGNHRNGNGRNGSQWTQYCNHWAPRSARFAVRQQRGPLAQSPVSGDGSAT